MKKQSCYLRFVFVLLFMTSVCSACMSQSLDSSGNEYIRTDKDKMIVRLFLSRKFAPFTISSSNKEDLNYKTNSKLNLGAGFTYKIITVNLSYGFNFLNRDEGRGDTKGLDLQFHIYPRKWAIDLLGAFLKGYYLEPNANNGLNLTGYYKRPDLSRNIVGLSVIRVANPAKFSYRAALSQIDWQTKSAGSLLFGGESYYGMIKGDSALVPSKAGSNYGQAGITQIKFFTIGPGVGYAYTLVLSKHFFATASAVACLHFNFASEEKTGNTDSRFKVIPGGIYKSAIGYNSSSWTVSATFLGNALYASSAASSKEYFVPTGSINLFIGKKIGAGSKRHNK